MAHGSCAGELAQRFYIIISGEVQVCRQLGEEEQIVATLRPGEYFGEIALLQGVRHTASVRALSPVDLLTIDGADFTALATSSTQPAFSCPIIYGSRAPFGSIASRHTPSMMCRERALANTWCLQKHRGLL